MTVAAGDGPVALHVIASPGPAIRIHLGSVLPRLQDRGVTVQVALGSNVASATGRPGTGTARDLAGDLTPIVLPVPDRSGTFGDIAAATALRRLVRPGCGIDVLHAHGFRSCAIATLALRGLRGRPVLVTSWYDLALPTGAKGLTVRTAERLIARSADVTLATSLELQARARDLGARDVRMSPVAPGVPPPAGDRAALRARYATDLGLDPDRPWVLVVGRLVPERSGLLLTVAERWNVLHPPPEVLAIGEGAPAVVASLAHAVAGRGLPLHLLGSRDDEVTLMQAGDVLVTTSRWESRPIAVQQAMQVGLPVVAARLAGIAELVADTGVLVDADDVEALAAEVASLLADPVRAARLARRAMRRAGTFPTEDEVADAMAGAYADALGRRRPVRV